jgi:hypothetical protein
MTRYSREYLQETARRAAKEATCYSCPEHKQAGRYRSGLSWGLLLSGSEVTLQVKTTDWAGHDVIGNVAL